jgi:hypothetical protein
VSAAREQWHLTLVALPSSVPAANRIRRLLKFALRGLGLKCVALDEPAELARLRAELAELKAERRRAASAR